MGAGCSTATARHVEGGITDDRSQAAAAVLPTLLGEAVAAGQLALYQHGTTGAYVLVPASASAPSHGRRRRGRNSSAWDGRAAAAALGSEWRRVPSTEQARVIKGLKPPPVPTQPPPSSRADDNDVEGAAAAAARGEGEDERDDEELSVGDPVEDTWPPVWAEEGQEGGWSGDGSDDDEEDPLMAAQRQQQRQQGGQLAAALRCRVCGREVPNKALLDEHLAACVLVADAREQTRGTDGGLRLLSADLRQLLEEQMRMALHTGGWWA